MRTVTRVGLIAIVAVLVLVAWRSRETPPAASPQPVATSSTPFDGGSKATTKDPFTMRVLAFEQAYNLLEPKERYEALRPFSSQRFLAVVRNSMNDSEHLQSLREGDSISLDHATATVVVEAMDETDTVREVSSRISVTKTTSNGGLQAFVLRHTTYWVLETTGEWVVYDEVLN